MRSFLLSIPFALSLSLVACGGGGPETPARSPAAQKWMSRAEASYRSGDLDDAQEAVTSALKDAPKDEAVRLLAARIAIAHLDYPKVLELTEGMETTEAKSLRGRAFWYQGDIERAADELEDMLRDPQVKDPWARDVARLARQGHGRHPFAVEGGLLASVDMPQAGPALVVPCELEGERILAVVSTGMGEVMIDSSTRKDPSWVNFRFGENFEVKDVPALPYDLSNMSRQLGGAIKAIIGVNFLRHLHTTFDRRGSQFVVRKMEPPPPPGAARVPLVYVRGGGMMVRGHVAKKDDGALLFVDTGAFFPLALDDQLLKESGADLAAFHPEPGAPPNWKIGYLPYFKLGPIDLPQIPALQGAPLGDYKGNFDVDLGGVVGAGILSIFRVTFADEGRSAWFELDPTMTGEEPQGPAPAAAAPSSAPAPAPAAAPAPGPAPAPAPAPKAPKKPAPGGKGAAQ